MLGTWWTRKCFHSRSHHFLTGMITHCKDLVPWHPKPTEYILKVNEIHQIHWNITHASMLMKKLQCIYPGKLTWFIWKSPVSKGKSSSKASTFLVFRIFINFPGVCHNLFEKPTQKWKIHDLSVVPWLKRSLCSTPFIYSFPGPGRWDWHAEKTANLLNYVFRCIDKSVVYTQGHESICVEKISYIHIHVYITHSSAYHKKIGLQSFTGPTGHAIRAKPARLCVCLNILILKPPLELPEMSHASFCFFNTLILENLQLSYEKSPGWLGYIRDYTTQLYRDYKKPL